MEPTRELVNHELAIAKAAIRGGHRADAEAACQRALAIDPNNARTTFTLAALAEVDGRLDDSLALIRRAIVLAPPLASFYHFLGRILCERNELDEAITALQTAASLDADVPYVYRTLVHALRQAGRFDEAKAVLEAESDRKQAVELVVESNRLIDAGRIDEALARARTAVSLRPNDQDTSLAVREALMYSGNFVEAWPYYRPYLSTLSPRPDAVAPRWDGSPLASRTILLVAADGFGDCLQWIRLASTVAAQAGRVLLLLDPTAPEWTTTPSLRTPEALGRLFANVAGVDQVFVDQVSLPPVDWEISLLHLPIVLGHSLDRIPAPPYLHADPALVEEWAGRLGRDRRRPRVGLVWSGNRCATGQLQYRAISLSELRPVWETPGIDFYSLQIGPRAAELQEVPDAPLIDRTAHIRDFAETAAFIANLDLVITVDASPAHLAGAVGAPTWLLLQSRPDVRWLLSRDDCPLYPSMRLFRQHSACNWAPVVATVARELAERFRSET